MKQRLGIDVDNCVAATDLVMRRIIHHVTNGRVNFRYGDIREFDYHGSLCHDENGERIDEATWKEVHDHFSEPEVVLSVKPLSGALEAIRTLQPEFEIHFITTRKPKARAATIHWLDQLGLDATRPHSLHFVAHREKHEVITNLAAAIDDDLGQAMLFADCGVRSIVLAHPWNTAARHPVERAGTWGDVLRLLRTPN